MKLFFIASLGDIIGVGILVIILLIVGVIYLREVFRHWRLKRLLKKEQK